MGKGLKLQSEASYFVLVLLVRGSASALFKATCVSLIVKKPLKLKKAKTNLIFITIPSVILYLFREALRTLHFEELEKPAILFFTAFMVVNRFYRALAKILESMRGSKPK